MFISRVVLISCFILSVSTISAQIVYPADKVKWELSGFAGWGQLSGPKTFPTPVADGTSKLVTGAYKGGYVLGLRVSENMGKRFGGELAYSASARTLTLSNLQSSLPPLDLEQIIHSFSYSGIFHLADLQKSVRPYALFGGGAALFNVSGDSRNYAAVNGIDLKRRWKFALVFGGGVKWLFGEKWGLQFDFRDNMTGVPDYGLPSSAPVDGVAFRPSGNLHDLQFTAGFVYRFTGR